VLAERLFNRLSEVINEQAWSWMSIDVEKEPERTTAKKSLWGKALCEDVTSAEEERTN
jgi:hypothetical protein